MFVWAWKGHPMQWNTMSATVCVSQWWWWWKLSMLMVETLELLSNTPSVWPILLLLWVIVHNHVDRPIGAGIVFASLFTFTSRASNGLFIFRLNCSFIGKNRCQNREKSKNKRTNFPFFFPFYFYVHQYFPHTYKHDCIRIVFHSRSRSSKHSTDYFSFFMRFFFWPLCVCASVFF